MRTHIVRLAKVAVSAILLAYLVADVRQNDPQSFARLLHEPKRWDMLLAGWGCFAGALAAGLWRWQRLGQALLVPLAAGAAARIGALAYLFDFAAFGAVGGDLFKAVSLARLYPDKRAVALATVVADRAIGLGTLLLFASAWLAAFAAPALPQPWPQLALAVWSAAGLGCLGCLAAWLLQRFARALSTRVATIAWVGPHLANLLLAFDLLLRRPRALAEAVGLSLVVLTLNASGYWLLSQGLPGLGPTWTEHLLIVPLASLSALIPLPADTLGVLDYVMSFLYEHVTQGRATPGFALMVVMSYRAVGVAVSMLGLVLYLRGRRGEA